MTQDRQTADEELLLLIQKTAGMPNVRNSRAEFQQLLHKHLADGACVNGPKRNGELLRLAVVAIDVEVVRALLEHGADPNAPVMAPKGFYTTVKTLHYAAELLDRCKNVRPNTQVKDLDLPFHSTLLHETILSTPIPELIVVSLIAFGADPHAQNAWGMSPLQTAYSPGYERVENALFSPLHAAVVLKDLRLCQLLLNRGYSEEAKNKYGNTSSAMAKAAELTEICALFDAKKAERAVHELIGEHRQKPALQKLAV